MWTESNDEVVPSDFCQRLLQRELTIYVIKTLPLEPGVWLSG